MKIAVLSGKGGTGKTFVTVNLASIAKDSIYLDCDVEEPNGHLFFSSSIDSTKEVTIPIPTFSKTLCNGCRKCVEFCKFNALSFIKDKPFLFEDICHSCGGCLLVCPTDAITEIPKAVGTIEQRTYNTTTCLTGKMALGISSGVPVIKEVLKTGNNLAKNNRPIFIDCPPGSACTVNESIANADYCILVAEPTIFGAHNFAMVLELARLMKKPIGVILNKCTEENNPTEDLCLKENLPILAKIPYNTNLFEVNSSGEIATEKILTIKKTFENVYQTIKEVLEVQS